MLAGALADYGDGVGERVWVECRSVLKEMCPLVPLKDEHGANDWKKQVNWIGHLEEWGDPLSLLLSVPPIMSEDVGLSRYIGSSSLTGSALFQQVDTLVLALLETVIHAAVSDNVRYMELKLAPSSLLGRSQEIADRGVSIALLALAYVTDRAVGWMGDTGESGLFWLMDSRDGKAQPAQEATGERWPYILANLVLAGKRQGDPKSLRQTVITAVDSRDRFLWAVQSVRQEFTQEAEKSPLASVPGGDVNAASQLINDKNKLGLLVPRVVGTDLVGRERGIKHGDLRDSMAEAFEKCILLTIHAGEDESERSIWDAIFELHAQRIGHALRVRGENLANLIRDRRIPIELCPLSNRYTNGYSFRKLANQYVYPEYQSKKITMTINTDDPWISHRLDRLVTVSGKVQPYPLSDEFVALPLLFREDKPGDPVPGKVKRIDVLQLIYNGFDNCFLSAPERDDLLALVDLETFLVLSRLDLPYKA